MTNIAASIPFINNVYYTPAELGLGRYEDNDSYPRVHVPPMNDPQGFWEWPVIATPAFPITGVAFNGDVPLYVEHTIDFGGDRIHDPEMLIKIRHEFAIRVAADHAMTLGYPAFIVQNTEMSCQVYLTEDVPNLDISLFYSKINRFTDGSSEDETYIPNNVKWNAIQGGLDIARRTYVSGSKPYLVYLEKRGRHNLADEAIREILIRTTLIAHRGPVEHVDVPDNLPTFNTLYNETDLEWNPAKIRGIFNAMDEYQGHVHGKAGIMAEMRDRLRSATSRYPDMRDELEIAQYRIKIGMIKNDESDKSAPRIIDNNCYEQDCNGIFEQTKIIPYEAPNILCRECGRRRDATIPTKD